MTIGFWESTYTITSSDQSFRVASFGDTALHLAILQAVCTVGDPSGTSVFSVGVTDDSGIQNNGPNFSGSNPLNTGAHSEAIIPISGGLTIRVVQSGTAGQVTLRISCI